VEDVAGVLILINPERLQGRLQDGAAVQVQPNVPWPPGFLREITQAFDLPLPRVVPLFTQVLQGLVEDRTLQVEAELATARRPGGEAAVEHLHAELEQDVLDGVLVAQHGLEVAPDGPPVTLEEAVGIVKNVSMGADHAKAGR
jgi:hypothetical protein